MTLAATLVPRSAAGQVLDIAGPSFEAGEREVKSVNVVNVPRHGAPRSSHEVNAAYAPLDWLKLAVHLDLENVADGSWQADHAALEFQVKLVEASAKGGVSLAWFTSIEVSTHKDATNTLVFGPIASVQLGPATFTLNTYFGDTIGRNRSDGLAFQYGGQARVEIGGDVAVGIEAFGKLEDVTHPGPVAEQDHRLGPAMYIMIPPEGAGGHALGIEAAMLFGVTEASPAVGFKLSAAVVY